MAWYDETLIVNVRLCSHIGFLLSMLGMKLTLNGAADPRETSVKVMIPGIHGIKFAFSSVIDPRETNVKAMILSMHGIRLALYGAASSRETNILALVLGMHGTILEHLKSIHQLVSK